MPDLEDLIELFCTLTSWEDKYGYIIELGKKLEPYPDDLRREEFKVKGCTSQVWLTPIATKSSSKALFFYVDSDALIVKGLAAILMVLFDGKSAQEISELSVEDVFKTLGLEGHLSPIRRNGFFSMVQKFKSYANAYRTNSL